MSQNDTWVRLQGELETVVFGQSSVVRHVLIGLLARGHVLLQGVPGVGKTRLARALALMLAGEYRRIQFTPDLMPSDILGNAVYQMHREAFEVHQGPIFANLVLADEVNRTPPKTQAALLEAMEERQVSIYGETFPLPNPFFVIATQNPIEYEGTYPLPEAELDRFLMQVSVGYPDEQAEKSILDSHFTDAAHWTSSLSSVASMDEVAKAQRQVGRVTVADEVKVYIVNLVRASRELAAVSLGASPRAATALLDAAKACAFLEDRSYVIPDDVQSIVHPVLRHRLVLSPSAQLEGTSPDDIITQLVESVQVPR